MRLALALLVLVLAAPARGAITFFGSATNPADNGSLAPGAGAVDVAVTPPASMQDGDLVLMFGMVRDTGVVAGVTTTGGQAWTALTNRDGTAMMAIGVWARFNGTWSTNPAINFTMSSGTIGASVQMLVFRPTASAY